MHNAGFSYVGLNWRYVPLAVRTEHLAVAIRGMAALGFRGINVTVPHKVDVIPYMDNITEAVTIVGAVNTIRVDRNTGRLEGLNTDMGGFLTDLAANRIGIGKDSRIVVLGAGCAARAVCAGLVRSGAQVTVVNRTPERAQSIVAFMRSSWAHENIEAAPLDSLPSVPPSPPLIVTTPPLALCPH